MSATDESLRILNATLTPVIIFFVLQNRGLLPNGRELIHKLHLACQRFLIQCRAANRNELPNIFAPSASSRHAPSFYRC